MEDVIDEYVFYNILAHFENLSISACVILSVNQKDVITK